MPRRVRKSSQRRRQCSQDKDLTVFICDYMRLLIMGNARTHEIESLMEEEIETSGTIALRLIML